MKQVVFLIDSLSRSGGLERFVQSTCELLKDHYSTHVVKFDGKNQETCFPLPNETKLHSLPKFKKNRYLARFPKGQMLTAYITKTLKELEGEIILIPVGTRVLEYALKYLSDDYKIIACEHRNSEAASKLQEAKNIRAYAHKAACWMALTQFDKKNYEKLHDKVFHIPNYTPLATTPVKEKDLSRGLELVSLGHVTPIKGFDRAIEYLKKLDKTDLSKKISYHIYGDLNKKPSYVATLKEEIKDLENIEVIFHGVNKNLSEIFNRHHVYLMSSREEAFGLVLIEAKAHGLPCISIDAPYSSGPREIIQDGVDGFVCRDFKGFELGLESLYGKQYGIFSQKALDEYSKRFKGLIISDKWRTLIETCV